MKVTYTLELELDLMGVSQTHITSNLKGITELIMSNAMITEYTVAEVDDYTATIVWEEK